MPTRFCTLGKAAEQLGLSRRTLATWATKQIIPAYRPDPKGIFLVDIAEVEEAIRAKRAQEREDPADLKQRLNAIVDKMKADIAAQKKYTAQQVKPQRTKKASAPHEETIH